MVFFKQSAIADLHDILFGLIRWKKHPLNPEHALNYVDDITDVCYTLDKKSIHLNAVYKMHQRYGKKVHCYRRGANTQWNIIYDLDQYGNVYINKIISNHTTNL